MRIRTALMWFDNNPRTAFEEKVAQAVAAYRGKFGRQPDICYANPADLPALIPSTIDVRVEAEPSVLRHHLLVGISRP